MILASRPVCLGAHSRTHSVEETAPQVPPPQATSRSKVQPRVTLPTPGSLQIMTYRNKVTFIISGQCGELTPFTRVILPEQQMTAGHLLIIPALSRPPFSYQQRGGLRLSGGPYRMHRSQQWLRCGYHFGVMR